MNKRLKKQLLAFAIVKQDVAENGQYTKPSIELKIEGRIKQQDYNEAGRQGLIIYNKQNTNH